MTLIKQSDDTFLLGLGALTGIIMTLTLASILQSVQQKIEAKAQERMVCELHAGYQSTQADTVALIKSMPNCAMVFYEQR